jgi:hypothetical protein
MKKWANELNRDFSKEEVQMAEKHMKKCSVSLAKKEMQIKTTLTFHLSPIRMATIKNSKTNVDEDVEKKEPSYTSGGNIN